MEFDLSSEQIAQLSRFAALEGRPIQELAHEAVERFLAEEARFHTAIQAGKDAAARGEFLPASEIWASIERELKS